MRFTDKWVIPSESLCSLYCYKHNNGKLKKGLCEKMKEVPEVFKENLLSISDSLDSSNLRACFLGSANLTIFSTMADYDDGVIITEMLQNVFSEVGPLFDEYQMDEKDSEQLMNEMKKYLKDIIKNYDDKNKNDLYIALKNMRCVATKFQMQCWKLMKKKTNTSKPT
jgi:hypothetical protein